MVTNTNLLHNSTKLNLFHYKAKVRVQSAECYEGLHGYRHEKMDRRKRDQQREGEVRTGLPPPHWSGPGTSPLAFSLPPDYFPRDMYNNS